MTYKYERSMFVNINREQWYTFCLIMNYMVGFEFSSVLGERSNQPQA